MRVDPDDKELDENASLLEINCITSPLRLLHNQYRGDSFLHKAVTHNSFETLTAVLQFISSNVDKITANTEYADNAATQHPKQKKTSDILETLLTMRNNMTYIPFELAIALGYTNIASALLEFGGIDAPQPKVSDEEMYEGLDVGGKKMDWVKEQRSGTHIVGYMMID